MALIKCRECGKEISSEAKACPNCGCPVKTPEQPKKNNNVNGCSGCLLTFLIVIGVFLITSSYIDSKLFDERETAEQSTYTSTVVDTVFNARAFYNISEQRTFTEQELINVMGEPDSVEEWNFTASTGLQYPIRNLYYGNNEYKFHNDTLRRITLLDPIEYKSVDDFIDMFGCSKYDDTTIVDTGSTYRANNCGIYELYISYEGGKITWVNISYSDLFEK